jgi:large subunit ribosomal protein L17
MKKRKKKRELSRKRDQRKALLKSLAQSLILKEKIKTTQAKAKELRPFVEKMITKSKKGDLSSIRYLTRFFSKETVKKLINEIGPRYKDRPGGYTRIVKLGQRKSDGAQIAIIELV